MPDCPLGHSSATADYCDQCGTRIGDGSPAAERGGPVSDPEWSPTDPVTQRPPPAPAEPCPRCGTLRVAGARYCEEDGYDFAPRVMVRWEATVSADRAYFDAMAAEGFEFPASYPPKTFALDTDVIVIGRGTSPAGGVSVLDLHGTPEDDGISRRHAVLRRSADGAYSVADCGSTNGTMINGGSELLAPHLEVVLADGDRIHLGAWTTITIRSVPVV
jgi:FHA domain